MSLPFNKKKFGFYVRIGLIFSILPILANLFRYTATFIPRSINDLWLLSLLTVVHFILFEYTLRFFKLKWTRVLGGLLLLWLHMLVYSYGLNAWRNFGISIHIYKDLMTPDEKHEVLGYMFGYSLGSLFFFTIIRHIFHYIRLRQDTQQLRIEKQQAELNYLKSQTNPHFLFNTLNNIYSLARDKSDLAPESVLRLSKILRYMLYETSSDNIAIEQELKIISDYIALEKLRYDESLSVNFNYNVDNMKQSLPPLLLIPLVENAFKHGVSEARNRPFIDIHLNVQQQQLRYEVKNSHEGQPGTNKIRENIGLANLQRQLELLYKEFNLTIKPEVQSFTATLTINLASHV